VFPRSIWAIVLPLSASPCTQARSCFQTAPAQDLRHRILKMRTLADAARREPLETRQIVAGEEIDEIRCEEDLFVIPKVHPLPHQNG